jgi:hypothetical protein
MPDESAVVHPCVIVRDHFECLRRHVHGVIATRYSWSGTELPQDCAVALMLAVPAFDVFLNSYFGIFAAGTNRFDTFLHDCKERISIEEKLRRWIPRHLPGITPDLASGPFKAFLDVKSRRNKLVHFWSDLGATARVGETTIEGLADTTVYHMLHRHDAYWAYFGAEGAVREVLRLASGPMPDAGLMNWIGVQPNHRYQWGDWVPTPFNRRDGEPKITAIN